jgi:hypothetical protein
MRPEPWGSQSPLLPSLGTLMLCVAALSCFAFYPSKGYAGTPAGWYNGLTISYVYSGTTGNRSAVGVSTAIPGDDCTETTEFDFNVASAQFTQVWSIVLLAYAEGSQISVYTDGTCTAYGLSATDVIVGTPPW